MILQVNDILKCRATNRAKRLAEVHNDALCVAIEGGVGECTSSKGTLECFAWAVVLDPASGRQGQARSASFQLPPAVSKLIRQGVELGTADDQILGRKDSGKGSGTVGYAISKLVQECIVLIMCLCCMFWSITMNVLVLCWFVVSHVSHACITSGRCPIFF